MRLVRCFLLVCVFAFTLNACISAEPHPTSDAPTPTSGGRRSPFATEDEALAAATSAYQRFIDVSNAVLGVGQADPARFSEVAMPALAEDEADGALRARTRGVVRAGPLTFDSMRYEQSWTDDSGTHVITYACLDLSRAPIVDAHGADVTPSNRNDRVDLQLVWISADSSIDLKLERMELWDSTRRCS